MPLDAINPRMSALGTTGPALWMPPVPAGPGIDQADRQQSVGTYAGLMAGGAAAAEEFAAAFAGGGSLAAALAQDIPGEFAAAFAGGGTLAAAPDVFGGTFGAAFDGGGTLTAAPGETIAQEFAAAFGGGGILTAAFTEDVAGQFLAAFAGGGTLTAAADIWGGTLAAAFAGGGTLEAAALAGPSEFGAAFSGGGSLAASPTLIIAQEFAAAFDGGGSLTAAFTQTIIGEFAATFAGGGTLTAAATVGPSQFQAAFDGGGTLTASPALIIPGEFQAVFGGGGTLTASPRRVGTVPFLEALRDRVLEEMALTDPPTDSFLSTSRTGSPYPYLVVDDLGSIPTINSSDSWYEETQVQFTWFSQDQEQAERLCRESYRALFPGKSLGPMFFIDGYEMVRFPGMRRRARADTVGMTGGDVVWRADFTYTFLVGVD